MLSSALKCSKIHATFCKNPLQFSPFPSPPLSPLPPQFSHAPCCHPPPAVPSLETAPHQKLQEVLLVSASSPRYNGTTTLPWSHLISSAATDQPTTSVAESVLELHAKPPSLSSLAPARALHRVAKLHRHWIRG